VTLINLNPSTAATARALLPSLDRLHDSELDEVVKDLRAAAIANIGAEFAEGQ
jgi:hypothetical protein